MLCEKYLALCKYSVHVHWPELVVLLVQFPKLERTKQNSLSALGILYKNSYYGNPSKFLWS